MNLHTALRAVALPLLLAAAATVSFAQSRATAHGGHADAAAPPAPDDYSPRAALRARATQLAASTADAAMAWSDQKAAVQVLCEAADLLWGDDSDRARSWLKRAWKLAGEIPREGDDNAANRYRSNSQRARGRALVLAVAHRRDKALADDLFGQLAPEKEQTETESPRGIFDDKTARSEQLLSLSLAVVGSDPDAAAGLAELSMADGISFRLQSVLLALRERDQGAADRLFDAALRHLDGRPHDLSEAQVIASYLFAPGQVIGVGSDRTAAAAVSRRRPTASQTPAEADPARARRFLKIAQRDLLFSPAPSTTPNPAMLAQEIVGLAGTLEGSFKFYAPDLWTPVAQRVTAVLPDLVPRNSLLSQSVIERLDVGASTAATGAELNKLYVERLEETAEKEVDPVARKFAFIRAALATAPEDLPRGLSLAGRIPEESLRKRISSLLVYRAALVSVEKDRLDEATESARGLEPLQRALVYILAARSLSERRRGEDDVRAASRKARAVELLADAESALRKTEGSSEALRVRLGIVSALAPLDTARALDFLRDIVTDINLTDSFDPTDASIPRVLGLYGLPVQASLPTIRGGFSLKEAVSPLSQVEFEESVYIAGKLKAPSARGICMIEIARRILLRDDPAGQQQHAPSALQ